MLIRYEKPLFCWVLLGSCFSLHCVELCPIVFNEWYLSWGLAMVHYPGKLTKREIESLGAGRHSDGNGLHLVVKPSGARSWIVRVTIKGKRNSNGAPLRTDLGLGGVRYVSVQQAREIAIRYLGMARRGINPRDVVQEAVPTFEQMARIVHSERLPTWKNAKHAAQFINTLRDYTFPKIGNLQVNQIGQPEVLACLSPIWTQKHVMVHQGQERRMEDTIL